MTKAQASDLINVEIAFRKLNRPTQNQAFFLRRRGLSVPATKEEASTLIDRVKRGRR